TSAENSGRNPKYASDRSLRQGAFDRLLAVVRFVVHYNGAPGARKSSGPTVRKQIRLPPKRPRHNENPDATGRAGVSAGDGIHCVLVPPSALSVLSTTGADQVSRYRSGGRSRCR